MNEETTAAGTTTAGTTAAGTTEAGTTTAGTTAAGTTEAGTTAAGTTACGTTTEENRRRKRSATSSTSGKKAKTPTILKRTNAANSLLGLSVVLYPNEEEYGETVMNNYLGFKALVHSPFDFPEVGGKGLAVESEKEVPFLEYISFHYQKWGIFETKAN